MVDLLSGHKRSVESEDEGTVTLRRQEESGGLSDALYLHHPVLMKPQP